MRITQGLVRAVVTAADRTATIDGDRRRAWREVGDRVARLAGGLRTQAALQTGDRVAVLAHNCDVYFETYFGVLWAGGALTPLNTRLATPELAFQLKDAGVETLCFGEEFAAVAEQLLAEGAVNRLIAMDGLPGASAHLTHEGLIQASEPAEEHLAANDDLAGIFYTGGTTGLPKGVMLSHGNMHAIASNLLMTIPFDETGVNFHAAPMFHLADIGILFATMTGATHVFRRSFNAETMLEAIAEHGVTHCFTVPAVIDRMAKYERLDQLDLSKLKMLGYGGSSLPAATLALAREKFPNIAFIQGFGQTEMASVTVLTPQDHQCADDHPRLRSCGKVAPGFEIRIVDENGVEVPRGQIGEIVGRGDNVMQGYWNRPEETADVMRNGWLHTRDAGWMDEEGYIYITDRLKDMIVSGAENIYSIEVENALSWHPAIEEAAVIGVPDPTWGERVHAHIVCKAGAEQPSLEELSAFCRQRIAGYKTPKSVSFSEARLPRSAAGKIQKGPVREVVLKELNLA
ncbi:MAG: AMP-binding protein [Candidatus Brevundimonas phytovorans]|nr:AMP-binding protein [Brevundimonas sp.]WEK57984.1 MAG: AMP-binding protein [Brevundimonas sp.]